ncbi:MAG: GNAT family N-acetyltransferase [Flavobacteriales bacterium]|nr:GNAT family N-acetyltransferase [Flavobacteriales bacterium]
MRIQFIKTAETYPLRLQVLRPGGEPEDAHFATDRTDGAFHLGARSGNSVIAIASFHPEKHAGLKGWKQFRLRGMATHPDHVGKGIGKALLTFAMDHLKAQHADLLWCNARVLAVPFYEKLGFIREGPEFDIPGIGGHFLMHRKVR